LGNRKGENKPQRRKCIKLATRINFATFFAQLATETSQQGKTHGAPLASPTKKEES